MAGYESKKHGKISHSFTILDKRKIKNYQVEIHVDSHGPHIHLDRTSSKEKYINISNLSINEALDKLPNKLKKDPTIKKVVTKVLEY